MITKILTSGAAVNFALIIVGSAIGMIFKKGFPEKLQKAIMTGMGLCVFLIGVEGMFSGENVLMTIISVAIGGIIGELCDLDGLINKAALSLEKTVNAKGGKMKIAEGFTSATLLFCIGAMVIVGSLDSGIRGDNTTLYSKSIIDGVSAIALTSSLGIGVMFSALPVVLIEGVLTLLAAAISPFVSTTVVNEISCVGSLLVVAISLNMLGLTKIKVMNFAPAIFLPIILCLFM